MKKQLLAGLAALVFIACTPEEPQPLVATPAPACVDTAKLLADTATAVAADTPKKEPPQIVYVPLCSDDVLVEDEPVPVRREESRVTCILPPDEPGEVDTTTVAAAIAEDFIYDWVEEMPQFPGGDSAMKAFLAKNIHYPQIEKEKGKQGTVYVRFVVEKDGSLSDVFAVKEVSGSRALTNEAIRVIKSMPAWTPGKQSGKTVRVKMIIPVKFALQYKD